MKVKFFFNKSRGDIRSELARELQECSSLKVVTGFVTEAGIDDLGNRTTVIEKLNLLIFGHANEKALMAMSALHSDLEKAGRHNIIKIHFGYGNPIAEKDRLKQIYRPMMHSKVFLFDFNDGRFTAFVGSQNISGYSLRGLNSEAIVRIDGQITDSIYDDILFEIASIDKEAKTFKDEYLGVYENFHNIIIKGMLAEENTAKREYFSLLYAFIDINDKDKLKLGDTLYFVELEYTGSLTKIENYADVWIIPIDTTSGVNSTATGEMLFFRAIQTGANDSAVKAASYENINWHIPNYKNRIIKPLAGPNPEVRKGLQVLMQFEKNFQQVYGRTEYKKIQYIPASRQSNALSPIYSSTNKTDLLDLPNNPRIFKGEEILENNTWTLIDGFKEMSHSDYAIMERQISLPSPNEFKNNPFSDDNQRMYMPKVRVLKVE